MKADQFKIQIGFIGLGAMGAPVCARLLAAGCRVMVFDLLHERAAILCEQGALLASDLAMLAQNCQIIFTSLPSVEVVDSVCSEVLRHVQPGTILLETSTNALESARDLAKRFSVRGAEFLDAPVSGGPKGAASGRMACWVGGNKIAFDKIEPILNHVADRVTYVGPSGVGLITKLVHNCISQTTQAAIIESLSMGVSAGADPAGLWAALRGGVVGRRRTLDGLFDEILPRDFSRIAVRLDVVAKDMALATALGAKLGAQMRFAEIAYTDINEAMERDWGPRDARQVALLPQERANVQISIPKAILAEITTVDPFAPSDAKNGSGVGRA